MENTKSPLPRIWLSEEAAAVVRKKAETEERDLTQVTNRLILRGAAAESAEPKDTLTSVIWPRPGLTPEQFERLGNAEESLAMALKKSAKKSIKKR
jgi:hypothetical protein